jgi:hypothetical protein
LTIHIYKHGFPDLLEPVGERSFKSLPRDFLEFEHRRIACKDYEALVIEDLNLFSWERRAKTAMSPYDSAFCQISCAGGKSPDDFGQDIALWMGREAFLLFVVIQSQRWSSILQTGYIVCPGLPRLLFK